MGKKYRQMMELVDKDKRYEIQEAVALVKKTSYVKFDATVEAHIKLGIDPKKADQKIRGTVFLPHGTGKDIKILALAEKKEEQKAALEAGADFAGAEDYIDKIKEGWLDFDLVVAKPEIMKKIGPVAKTLGTKGLMPSPKAGTVTSNLEETVKELKAGRIEYKVGKFPLIHSIIGKVSFDESKLEENLRALIKAIMKAKPTTAKGIYLQGVYLAATMGPGIALNVQEFRS